MSERFEGLSLPELAELLHDIVVPPAVSMVPETVGWRIVGVWALVVAGIITGHLWLRWRRNRYRREAAASLRRLEKRLRSDAGAIEDVGSLLKRTALSAYPRERVASLHGDAWAGFLRRTSRDDPLVRAAAGQLAFVAYRPPSDTAVVLKAAHRWIRCHRG